MCGSCTPSQGAPVSGVDGLLAVVAHQRPQLLDLHIRHTGMHEDQHSPR